MTGSTVTGDTMTTLFGQTELNLPAVSVICFASSYLLAFLCELTRFFFRLPIRKIVIVGLAIAGLAAHAIFLVSRFQTGENSPWFFAGIFLSGLLVTGFVIAELRWPKSSIGLFILPTALALIGIAHAFPHQNETTVDALRLLGILHGIALLFGVAAIIVGCIAAIMFLIQSYRLKHKLPPHAGFWFPSLERLQKINESALLLSLGLVGLGLVLGIALNFYDSHRAVPWNDPLVAGSGVWLIWLVSIILFQIAYKPARAGRKVAYLTLGSFLFASMVFAILFSDKSAHSKNTIVPVETEPSDELRSIGMQPLKRSDGEVA